MEDCSAGSRALRYGIGEPRTAHRPPLQHRTEQAGLIAKAAEPRRFDNLLVSEQLPA
jgi:hypothetical protein